MNIYRTHTRVLLALVLCGFLLLSGCGNRGDQDSTFKEGDVLSEIDSARLSAVEERFRKEAEIRSCMRREGFEYLVGEQPSPPPLRFNWLLDSANVGDGYGIVSRFEEIQRLAAEDANRAARDRLSPSEREKWIRKQESCLKDSGVEIEQRLSDPTALALGEINVWIRKEFANELTAWSKCLSAKGFKVSYFDDLYQQVFESLSPLPKSERQTYERDVAQSDLDCRASFNEQLIKDTKLELERRLAG